MEATQIALAGKKVLVVEADIDFGFALAQILKEEAACQVIFATSAAQAFKIVGMTQPHLFLVNDHLPGTDGSSFVEYVRSLSLCEQVPVVLMSDDNSLCFPLPRSVVALKKPFGRKALMHSISLLLEYCPV